MNIKSTIIPIFGVATLALATIAGAGERAHGNWFQKLDADSNGTISQAEINAAGNAHFDKLDADGNGTLSKQEFNARKVNMLNKADTDANGEISADEWKTAKEKMRAHHGAKKR